MKRLSNKDLDTRIEGFMSRKAAEFPELRLREPAAEARMPAVERPRHFSRTLSGWRLHAAH